MLVAYFLLTFSLMVALKFPGSKKRKLSADMEAEAIVLQMESTGQYINNQPEVKLQVQVQPERGRNFISEVKAILPGPDYISCGARIWVKYSGNNVSMVI